MTHSEFTQILKSLGGLSPEQMQQLRRELDSKLAARPTAPTQQQSPAHKPIWEVAAELRASIPAKEWDKLPKDGASQHDHYIYGTPKRPAT
jgi:hypothetical protein